MTKPVWLLDFDGVVNAISIKPPTNIWPKEDWRRTEEKLEIYTFPILYANPVIEFLVEMNERVEIRWHTTWKENILPLASRMGLPEFPVQESSNMYEAESFWWKAPPALKVVLEEQRSLIWTDDDLSSRLDQTDTKILTAAQPCLLLCTNERHGLRKQDLELIKSSIEEFSIDGDQ